MGSCISEMFWSHFVVRYSAIFPDLEEYGGMLDAVISEDTNFQRSKIR
jgi:hypothetical protein